MFHRHRLRVLRKYETAVRRGPTCASSIGITRSAGCGRLDGDTFIPTGVGAERTLADTVDAGRLAHTALIPRRAGTTRRD